MGAPIYFGTKQSFLLAQRDELHHAILTLSLELCDEKLLQYLSDGVKAPYRCTNASPSIGPKGKKKQSSACDNPQDMDGTHSF